jgi:hypothetical protein
MATLTIQVDSSTVARAQTVARQRQTTLEKLMQEFLDELAHSADANRARDAQHLMTTLRELSRPLGGKPWKNRDELHER